MTSQVADLKDIIRGLRCKYFFKQEALAVAVNRCKSEIALWESGRRQPSEESLDRVAAALRQAGASSHEVETLWTSWRKRKPAETWDSAISSLPGDAPLYRKPFHVNGRRSQYRSNSQHQSPNGHHK